jgi:hypothetical protein
MRFRWVGTVAGFVLSLLGTILLFIGGLIPFASTSFPFSIDHLERKTLIILMGWWGTVALFSIGIIISLIGTGFLMYVLTTTPGSSTNTQNCI